MNAFPYLTTDEIRDADPDLVSMVAKGLEEKTVLYSKVVEAGGVVFKFFSSINSTILGSYNDYGRSLGGVRVMDYAKLDIDDKEDYAKFDAVNLGRAMARKWALLTFMGTGMYEAGFINDKELRSFYMGGGKSVIYTKTLSDYFSLPSSQREKLFKMFGCFLEEELAGGYMAGEDMNTTTEDMDAIRSETRYASCVSEYLGGTGNPSPVTAEGVYRYMTGLLPKVFQKSDLNELTIGIQGVGNVGAPLAKKIRRDFPKAKLLLSALETEVGKELANELEAMFVEPDKLIGLPMDIFSPNAGSETLNPQTIPKLIKAGVKLICGGANCQFSVIDGRIDHNLAKMCHDAGIYVAPDYAANLGGILNLSFEFPIPGNRYSLKRAKRIAAGNTDLAAVIYDMSRQYDLLPYQCSDYLADHVLAAFMTKNTLKKSKELFRTEVVNIPSGEIRLDTLKSA